MKSISSTELKSWIDSEKDFQLIDVRESDELEICNLSVAHHIALGTVPQQLSDIATDKPVVFMCRSGKRSSNALFYAQEQIKDGDFYNLEGGILGWISSVDNSMTPY